MTILKTSLEMVIDLASNMDGAKIDSGSDSVNIIGDGNSYHAAQPPTPSRTHLFTLCKTIIDSNIPIEEDYSLERNSAWQTKLDYNGISDEYKRILSGEEYAYDVILDIMSEFTNSEVMVLKVHHIYLDKLRQQKDSDLHPDTILTGVFDELKNLILNDENYSHAKHILDEDRDRSIWLIMFYVFTKCKLLEPVE